MKIHFTFKTFAAVMLLGGMIATTPALAQHRQPRGGQSGSSNPSRERVERTQPSSSSQRSTRPSSTVSSQGRDHSTINRSHSSMSSPSPRSQSSSSSMSGRNPGSHRDGGSSSSGGFSGGSSSRPSGSGSATQTRNFGDRTRSGAHSRITDRPTTGNNSSSIRSVDSNFDKNRPGNNGDNNRGGSNLDNRGGRDRDKNRGGSGYDNNRGGGRDRDNNRGGSGYDNNRGDNNRDGNRGGSGYGNRPNRGGGNHDGHGNNFRNDNGGKDRPGGFKARPDNRPRHERPGGGDPNRFSRYSQYRYHDGFRPHGPHHDRFYDHYRYGWNRPIMPPARHYRHTIWYYRPTIPYGFRPYRNAPIVDGILGIFFGTLYDASLDYLYYNGFNIDGYYDNIVYLRDVPLFDYEWPDVMLRYDDYNQLNYAQFAIVTGYNDRSRYNHLYRRLCASYGNPVSYVRGSYPQVTWIGGDGRGYITLSLNHDAGRYYTALSFGY